MTNLSRRRLAALAFAMALGASPSASWAQGTLDAIGKAGRVRVGIPTDFPPWGSMGPDGQPRGLDIDIARAIADKLNAKVELVPVPSSQRLPWLQERKLDLVISTLGKTPEREKLIDYSDAYGSFYLMVFGPKSSAVGKPEDLKGMTVAVSRGTVENAELSKLAATGVQIVRFEGNAATLSAYAEGKTQLLAAGTSVVAALAPSHPQLGIDPKLTLKEQQVHVSVSKGEDALRERVNAIIKELRADGSLRKLKGKWLSRAGMAGS